MTSSPSDHRDFSHPGISIVLRSYNDGWCIRETVDAIQSQPWLGDDKVELIAVDNASSDGSAEYLEEVADRFVHVPAGGYEPGPVLNAAVESARFPWVVFLNSDATPQDAHWLQNLLKPLTEEKVAAVYGRQIPRPDAWPMVEFDLLRGYPPHSRPRDGSHFFSFVSAAFKKSVWEQQRFWDRGYAEDFEWTLRVSRAGHELAYAHDSVVMHSHNYTRAQMWKKKYRHGWADAKIFGKATPLRQTLFEATKDVARDVLYGLPKGHLLSVFTSPFERFWQRFAFHRGSVHALREPPSPSSDSAPTEQEAEASVNR